MRCPSPCWTPMDPSGDRRTHTCPSCGKVCTLRDSGYIPAPGYTPSPLRVPVDPFKPLPDEIGWERDGDAFDAAVPKRLMTKDCRDCDQPFKPNNSIQVRCTPCTVAHRRATSPRRRKAA